MGLNVNSAAYRPEPIEPDLYVAAPVGPEQLRLRRLVQTVLAERPELAVSGPLYRGFSQAGYSELDLLNNLTGDRTNDVRSWTYTNRLAELIAAGISLGDAIVRTDEEIAAKITPDLASNVNAFLAMQRLGSFGNVRLSDSVNFATKLEGPVIYAKAYLKARLAQAKDWRPLRAFVLEVQERQANGLLNYDTDKNGIFGAEYHMFSHLRATDVRGAYMGFPQNRRGGIRWYYLQVKARNQATGRPTELALYSVQEKAGAFFGYQKIADTNQIHGKMPRAAEIGPLFEAMSRLNVR